MEMELEHDDVEQEPSEWSFLILSMEGAWAPWALALATKAFSRAAGGLVLVVCC